MKQFIFISFILCLISCKESETQEYARLVKDWNGRELIFPDSSIFTIHGLDTVDFKISHAKFKIVTYIDSTGCTSCKLQLKKWINFINEIDSLTENKTQFLFYFNLKNIEELKYMTQRENFVYPICIDKKDEINKLNKFPSKSMFQTFLLDSKNKVIAIGNPIYNPKIRELYSDYLLNNNLKFDYPKKNTEISFDKTLINLGKFSINNSQQVVIKLKNIGKSPLVIYDMVSACGCLNSEYEKKPINVGDSTNLRINYNAEERGVFHKTVHLYCNIINSPVQITITGEAK